MTDGCDGAIACDATNGGVSCSADQTCVGGACKDNPKCVPTTCEALGAECGKVGDGCGGVVDCDEVAGCLEGEVCGTGSASHTCVEPACVPLSAEAACSGTCGLVGDGCGGVLDCGACTTAGETCGGAGVPNQCGAGSGGCTPTTCEAQGVECGAASNGCGGLLDCGGCPAGASCKEGLCVASPK